MQKKTLVGAVLMCGFLGCTYIAISQTAPSLLAPFMVKRCRSITVGSSKQTTYDNMSQIGLPDVGRAIKVIQFPISQGTGTSNNPVMCFACQFQDMDSLAKGVMDQNAKEKFWDSDGLFHVIAQSGRCSSGMIAQLQSCYCTCQPH